MRTILLLLDTSKTSIHRFLAGIAKYSRLHGPWTFNREAPFYMTGGRKRKPDKFLTDLQPDGIIMHDTESSIARAALSKSIPVVMVRNVTTAIPGIPDIVGETEQSAVMAAEHLIARGFKNFAFCGYPGGHYWTVGREKSFCRRIEKTGDKLFVYPPRKSGSKYKNQSDKKNLTEWLVSLPKAVGIMACNDDRSQEIVEACKTANIHVPEEVAIIGVDNDTLICELANPPLSSVAVNSERAGFEAAEILDEMMSQRIPAKKTIVVQPTHIVTRQSTDVLAISDPSVAKAVNFIHRHCNQMLQVEDVVHSTLLSRRVLQQRFKQVTGRSIRDEIRRVRVDQIVRMLTETNMSVTEIANAMGFPDVHHIARYFRKEKGMSLLEYRKKMGAK